jgi:hypothetical protein
LVVLIRFGAVSCDFWHNSVLSVGFPASFCGYLLLAWF